MELNLRAAALGLAVAGFSSAPLAAQQSAAPGPASSSAAPAGGTAVQSHIMGFSLVPWGATSADIERAYGKPLMERVAGDTGTVLIYRDASSIFSLFYLDKTRGLVKGVSSIPYGPGSGCETVFSKSKESISRIYSTLHPVENRKQDDTTVPFCDAAAAGKASWSVNWTDPASKNSVRIELAADAGVVEVTYQSGEYQPAAN